MTNIYFCSVLLYQKNAIIAIERRKNMKISIIATPSTTDIGDKERFNEMSGTFAGICYMPSDYDTLANEPRDKTLKRANSTKSNRHHSVFEHEYITLCLENIPKIFAMILNNEKIYTTSEKSARYTKMQPTPLEKELYFKWLNTFKLLIQERYPNEKFIDNRRAEKLAMENARYLLSIYTPTTMAYTTSYRQLNYLYNWLKTDESNPILRDLKPYTEEFCNNLEELNLIDDELQKGGNGRRLSLFGTRDRQEYFGEVYSTNYEGSYAQLAQAQRHRTLSYEMQSIPTDKFYVPKILNKTPELIQEWLTDMQKVKNLIPQGQLIKINERGTVENFILKMKERLCSCAQLEINDQTRLTLNKYIFQTPDEEIKNMLQPYTKGARCLADYHCTQPCGFKDGIEMTRDI